MLSVQYGIESLQAGMSMPFGRDMSAKAEWTSPARGVVHAKQSCASQLVEPGIGDKTGCDASPGTSPLLAPAKCTLMDGVTLCTAKL